MPIGPAIVLVESQLGENIGMAIRAMANCALSDLRLVRPRDGWPNEKSVANAAGADAQVGDVRLFETTEAAIADLTEIYATTARPRGMIKRVLTPEAAVSSMRKTIAAGGRPGVLFGPERTGLNNDDVALADAVISVPVNPAFSSLNLAQAVMVVGYEWFRAGANAPRDQLVANRTLPATKGELHGFFDHLERELDRAGFLGVPEKRPSMVRNIRNIFERAALTETEIKTLHGIVTKLVGSRWPGRRAGADTGADRAGPGEDGDDPTVLGAGEGGKRGGRPGGGRA
jgi:tRNA/rRNA methyltransferase